MTTTAARILVVDDNDSGRYVTVHTLKRAGYLVSEARSGAEALSLLAVLRADADNGEEADQGDQERPDLIVLDINMPDMDGFEVCRRIKADVDSAQIPVLMASGSYLTAENTAHGLNLGADAYLAHPIEPPVLIATLRALLRVRAAEAEVRQLNLTLERRVLERTEELQRLNEAMSLTNEELEAFSFSVSHDLRTPVRHVKGFVELARRALDAQNIEVAVRHLGVVERSADRMNALIDGMLRLSRTSLNDLHLVTVDLQHLVTVSLEELSTELLGRRVVFEVSPLPSVQGDQDSLQQVVTNLLSNAVKYTRLRDEARIEIWTEEDEDFVTVSVQDNGAGFDPAYQERLFGLFQRLHSDREFEGVGVGLAVVRRVISRHGGSVRSEGRLGEGATFSFTLPRHK
ncbi:sensor histidine kinase [Deinococcus sp. UYEF24]